MLDDVKSDMWRQANRVIGVQAVVAVAIAIIYGMMADLQAALSAFSAGVIVVAANYFFAWRVFSVTGASAVQKIVSNFYIGEALKLLLTAVLVVFAIKVLAITPLPFFTGYAVTQIAFWFAFALGVSLKTAK